MAPSPQHPAQWIGVKAAGLGSERSDPSCPRERTGAGEASTCRVQGPAAYGPLALVWPQKRCLATGTCGEHCLTSSSGDSHLRNPVEGSLGPDLGSDGTPSLWGRYGKPGLPWEAVPWCQRLQQGRGKQGSCPAASSPSPHQPSLVILNPICCSRPAQGSPAGQSPGPARPCTGCGW